MVERGKGTVRIEVVPWLTQPFGHKGSSRLIIDEEVDREMLLVDLLKSMAKKYPAMQEAVLNFETGEFFDHVNVIHNDTMIGSTAASSQTVRGGDSIVFLPAYTGG